MVNVAGKVEALSCRPGAFINDAKPELVKVWVDFIREYEVHQ